MNKWPLQLPQKIVVNFNGHFSRCGNLWPLYKTWTIRNIFQRVHVQSVGFRRSGRLLHDTSMFFIHDVFVSFGLATDWRRRRYCRLDSMVSIVNQGSQWNFPMWCWRYHSPVGGGGGGRGGGGGGGGGGRGPRMFLCEVSTPILVWSEFTCKCSNYMRQIT